MSLIPFQIARQPAPPRRNGRYDHFDRLFDNFFNNALTNIGAAPGDAVVRIDISETPASYLVKAELPGIEEKDVSLTVEDSVLTLSGEKHSETEEEGKTFHRVERSYGSFRRALQLPLDADEESVTANMKNGVLTVEIAKTKDAPKKEKKIDIQSA
jgi:HSP20 family protein